MYNIEITSVNLRRIENRKVVKRFAQKACLQMEQAVEAIPELRKIINRHVWGQLKHMYLDSEGEGYLLYSNTQVRRQNSG